GLQTVQQQSAAWLAIVSDRPKPFCLLERVIAQGRGVLSQNHHLLRGHASPGIVLMRSHEALKLQIRSAIFNEGIGGFAPRPSAEAGIKAPVRMSPAVLQHPAKPPMERDMAQIQSVQFFLDPMVLLAVAEDGTGHHCRQPTLLEPGAGLRVPLPNPDVFGAPGSSVLVGAGAAPAQALTDTKPVGGD